MHRVPVFRINRLRKALRFAKARRNMDAMRRFLEGALLRRGESLPSPLLEFITLTAPL